MGIVIRQSIKGTIINYIGAFIGFLINMFLITKFLTTADVGLTRVILEIGLLFSSLALMGSSSSTMRFFPYFRNEKKKHNGFFFYLMMLVTAGCLIFIIAFVLLKAPLTAYFGVKSPLLISYFYWIIPLIAFLAYWTAFESYSNVNMRIVMPKFVREILVRVLLVVVYLLYGYHIISRDKMIGSFIGVYGVAMVVMFIYISRIAPVSFKHDNSFISKPLRKDIRNYTLLLLLGIVGNTLLTKLDIFMTTSMMGLEFTGVYAIALNMALIIEIPMRSITAISSPIAANALKSGNFNEANDLYKKVSLHQLMAGALIFLCIWINIDNIYAIIPNGEVYAQGKWVVLFIGLAKLVEITLNFGGVLISFSKYYYWSFFMVFIILAIGICTNLLLIPHLGITGAALATLISTLLSLSFQQWIVLRKVKGNPYSAGTLKVILIVIVLFALNYILPSLSSPWIDMFYRTAITGLLALFAVYFIKVSTEFNGIIDDIKRKIRK